MAKYRAIQTDFWEDGFVLDLTPEEKYFYLYILSNPRTTQCGCHELPYKVIEMQTGYNRETVQKLCFNPCFNGTYSLTDLIQILFSLLILCFNPCFNGTYSLTLRLRNYL